MRLALTTGALAAALASGPAVPPSPAAGVRIRADVAAGGRHPHRYERTRHVRRGHPRRAWREGYEKGLRHGFARGRRDARRHRGYEPWRHSRYRKATSGYRGRYGPRPAYRHGYREGFARAYERGFARAHRHLRHDRCRDGYRDGYRGRRRR